MQAFNLHDFLPPIDARRKNLKSGQLFPDSQKTILTAAMENVA
jgi:hypothetical protein